MKICVQLFAVAQQIAGAESLWVELPKGSTVADLRTALADAVPPLADVIGSAAIAVDADYVPEEMPIPADAEVAVIPPVSGG